MIRNIFFVLLIALPFLVFGEAEGFDTLSIRPIGIDYSKYPGNDKLYIVGECDGMEGNQIVVFQNRPSFDFFEGDEAYGDEQKELEKAIREVIIEKESMLVKGKWHKYNDRKVFLCHRIIKMKKFVVVN